MNVSLSDIERKTLAIIRNDIKMKSQPPTIKQLMIRTGRSELGVYDVLKSLTQKEYIEWDQQEPYKIKVIEQYERKAHWHFD